VRPRKPRPGGFGHHDRRYYGRCAGCIRWTETGARRVTSPRAASQETCHKQPGLKSKSRGLETSARAAVSAERRARPKWAVRANGWSVARAAPEARTGGNSRWRGAVNFQFAPSGAPPPLTLCGGETAVAFVVAAKLGRASRRENDLLHPPLEGDGRGPKGRGVGCAAMQGLAARFARFHPIPPRFAWRPSPSRGR
jgi:hypothetical protein